MDIKFAPAKTASVSGYVSSLRGDFTLADKAKTPVIYVDLADDRGVIRAAKDLCTDIAAVTNIITPEIQNRDGSEADVIIGTIGKSKAIDKLISMGKLNVSNLSGKWESFKIQIVDQTLVIVGSDKRGTIYGIYDLCEKIGVSPWKWWADVVPGHADGLYISLDVPYMEGEPSVKYRGIFINDEYAFNKWAVSKGDSDYIETYKHIYELLLRLKANFMWPAMHEYSPYFHKSPENAANADMYGIVMGSSHCEMMLRNNVSEYFGFEARWESENPEKALYKKKLADSPTPCAYVYVDAHPKTGERVYNKELLQAYWRESVELYGSYENLYTIGMRGLHDATWSPEGAVTNAEKAALLEDIIAVQRGIFADVLHKKPSEVPQLFIPYKEIQEIYDSGMDVPDDVTLMWTDDNYGYIRQLPTNDNRDRSGGAGIYYHVSYHGSPNSYIWLCTTPLSLIREEMSKAYDYGAKQVWVVNVGDLKPAEKQIEYFLDLARDVQKIRKTDLQDYISHKAIRDFGFSEDTAMEYADIELHFQEAAYARKPEHFASDLFHYEAFGDEGQRYLNKYHALVERSEALYQELDEAVKPAFYELQLYPLTASYHTARKYICADKSNLYDSQGRGSAANQYAKASEDSYYRIVEETKRYNSLLDGKWDLIMDPFQPYFRSRRAKLSNLLQTSSAIEVGYAALGVTSEKDMHFSGYAKDIRFLDIYNTGSGYLDWKATAEHDWILFNRNSGTVYSDDRIWVGINCDEAPQGKTTATVTITHQIGGKVISVKEIPITVTNTAVDLPEKTYTEANGYVSIEAEHYSSMTANGDFAWLVEKYLGRNGDSIKAYPNLAPSVADPDKTNSAYVDYYIYFESTGTFEVDIYRIPTLNERGSVRFAIGIDDETPTILSGTRAYVNDSPGTEGWGKGVYENNETLTTTITVPEPGFHTLRLYYVDPGIIIDKMVITTGHKEKSYFGAPESYNSTFNRK
ncbi:glycosyl hydrolase 115 family protein [Neobacillus sp. Marseille-QA0830]